MSTRIAGTLAALGLFISACSGSTTQDDGGAAGGTAGTAGGGAAGGTAGGSTAGGGATAGGGGTAGGASGGTAGGGTAGGSADAGPSPSGLSYATNPATYRVGNAIAPNAPSLDAGGQAVTFFVSGSLPLGLLLDPATGVLSGTPQVAVPAAAYRVLAMTSGGSTTADLTLAVTDQPRGLSYSTASAVYRYAFAIAPNLPSFDGGGLPVTFFIADGGALPNGLRLDAGTGVISGTPLDRTLPTTWTIGVGNDAGAATANISIAVYDPPYSLTYADDPVLYARGLPARPNVPTTTGLTGPVTFTSDAGTTPLPAGLAVDPATGVIAGIPTGTGTDIYPTLKVQNAFGSAITQIRIDVQPAATLTLTPPGTMPQVGIVNFGPQSYTVSGSVVLADDGVGVSSDACQSVTNDVVGKVMLVDRSPSCVEYTPALRGQAGGAVLVLIIDDRTDAGVAANLYLQNSAVQVPALIITHAEGAALKAALLSGAVTASATR